MIGLDFDAATTAALLLTRKGVTRRIAIGRQVWIVRLDDRGLQLRLKGTWQRSAMQLSWLDVVNLAERRAEEAAIREQLARRAERRIARGGAR